METIKVIQCDCDCCKRGVPHDGYFNCPHCDYYLHVKEDLGMVHTGEQGHKCPACEKEMRVELSNFGGHGSMHHKEGVLVDVSMDVDIDGMDMTIIFYQHYSSGQTYSTRIDPQIGQNENRHIPRNNY